MQCLECGKEVKAINYCHLKFCSGLTCKQYKEKHKILCLTEKSVIEQCVHLGSSNGNWKGGRSRICSVCGSSIIGHGKTGKCVICANSGENNGFWGKHHELKTKEVLAQKGKIRYKEHPETFNYGVVDSVTRSKLSKDYWMKFSYEERVEKTKRLTELGQKANKNCKFTKIERIISRCLTQMGVFFEWNKQIGSKWVDFLICNNIIIEAYGDYWHCNPQIYKEDYFHKDMKITAKEKWEKDATRVDLLQSLGYTVFVIWEKDIKKGKEAFIIEKINEFIKKESYENC